MTGKTGMIIQARTSSTRLPGKVLMPFIGDQSILDLQIEKLKTLGLPLVLATTTNSADDRLVSAAQKHQIEVFRGSEMNVLDRFITCANEKGWEYVMRVCSDNPFLDQTSISNLLNSDEIADYISYKNHDGTAAIKTHWGTFTELVKTEALKKVALQTQEKLYIEHVTNYVYQHPDQFKVILRNAPEVIYSRDDLRFTVDTFEDFENMQHLYQKIKEADRSFTLEDLVLTVDENPQILDIMSSGIRNFNK